MRAPHQAPSAGAGKTLRGTCRPVKLHCCPIATSRRRIGELAARAVTTHAETRTAGVTPDACDLVLSSGFLAFAGHAGFLQAVEEAGLRVGGVMGTSAGALVGSLYCAGYTPRQVAKHLSDQTPASLLRPSAAPWRGGALSLDAVIERLRDLLPPTFEELPREFAVGVVTADGRHLLIDSGPLPEAVAASAAIPFVFQAVDVPGHAASHGPFKDVHVIDRSSPFSGLDDTTATGEAHIVVVKSPRSGANFFDLGSFEDHMAAATERARPHLAAWRRRQAEHWAAAIAQYQQQQLLQQQQQQYHQQQQQQQQHSQRPQQPPPQQQRPSSAVGGAVGAAVASKSGGGGPASSPFGTTTTTGGAAAGSEAAKLPGGSPKVGVGKAGVGAPALLPAAAAAAAPSPASSSKGSPLL